jgi:thiamine-phosphate pyrophosphorylase
MLVTDRRRTRGRDLVRLVASAVRGGVGIVQVREPDLPDDELRLLVRSIRSETGPATTIVAHGSLRVALTARVGLHLPARAAPVGSLDLRGAPLGRSVRDGNELRRALADGPDYLLTGPIFPGPSAPEGGAGGVAALERLCLAARPTPVFAAGGVRVARVPAVIRAGAHGVAVCGAVLGANDPERVAQAMSLALEVACRSAAD